MGGIGRAEPILPLLADEMERLDLAIDADCERTSK
jgi:hypothetical protein